MLGVIRPEPGGGGAFQESGWHARSLLLVLAFTIPVLFVAGRGFFSTSGGRHKWLPSAFRIAGTTPSCSSTASRSQRV